MYSSSVYIICIYVYVKFSACIGLCLCIFHYTKGIRQYCIILRIEMLHVALKQKPFPPAGAEGAREERNLATWDDPDG